MFNKAKANKLLFYREGINYLIDLNELKISRPKIYRLTWIEAEVVKKYINKILGKGFIYSSNSLFASLVLVVKKPSGGLRIYIDY